MPDIKVAFWNLENLFDTTASAIATVLEFTPAEGWTDAVMQAKIQNLAEVVKLLHGGGGPDLLGVCEIENVAVAELLLAAIGRPDLKIEHRDSPDLRGIDTCLFYSNKVFKAPPQSAIRNHILHLRYPTRDILEVELELKNSPAKLLALVNHWPSRMQGRFETEPLRIATAERCGRIVDDYLKFGLAEFLGLPDTAATKQNIASRWNRNVLIMGDFNDEPYDRSILAYLHATKDLDVSRKTSSSRPAKTSRLRRPISERRPFSLTPCGRWQGARTKARITTPAASKARHRRTRSICWISS